LSRPLVSAAYQGAPEHASRKILIVPRSIKKEQAAADVGVMLKELAIVARSHGFEELAKLIEAARREARAIARGSRTASAARPRHRRKSAVD
jgi:hypothetical protein